MEEVDRNGKGITYPTRYPDTAERQLCVSLWQDCPAGYEEAALRCCNWLMTYGSYSATYSVDRVGFFGVVLLATTCKLGSGGSFCGSTCVELPRLRKNVLVLEHMYKAKIQTLTGRISYDGCAKTILYNSGHLEWLAA